MKTSHLILFAGSVLLAPFASAAEATYWSPYDLGTIDFAHLGGKNLIFRTDSDGGAFTLSQDVDMAGGSSWIRPQTYSSGGVGYPITFDFSVGNHKLTMGKNDLTWASYPGIVTFRGGAWNVPANIRAGRGTNVWDGVQVDCARRDGCYFWCSDGTGNVIALTNGAEIAGGSICFCRATCRENTVFVSNGSRVVGGTDNDRGSAGTDYGFASNKLVVTGSGTYYGANNTSAGYWSAGNTTLIDDHAAVKDNIRLVVGYGDYARSNTMVVANHAVVSNMYGLYVGYSAGATHNRLVMRNAAYRNANTYDAEQIGVYGSYNEAEFDTVDFKSLFRISCGIRTGANHNAVTMRGATKIANRDGSFRYQLFGNGQFNTQTFDRYSDNWPNPGVLMALRENDGLVRASTNNTVRFVNGSDIRLSEFLCQVSCASNMVLVQDSSFRANNNVTVRGDGNLFVLDDATLDLPTTSGYLVLGSQGDDTAGFAERNNRFIVRGAHPKFSGFKASATDTKPALHAYDGGRVVVEVPESGYDEADLPIFEGRCLAFHDDAALEIRVPAALQENAAGTLRYKLADAVEVDGDDADFLAELNAKLPAGCVAYRGDDECSLWLQVEPRPVIPDEWMHQHFPDAAKEEYDAIIKQDGDGDGLANWQEFICGSDPNDDESALALDVSVIAGKPVITWSPTLSEEEAAKRSYAVWGRDFATDEWTEITEDTQKIFLSYRLEVGYGHSTVLSPVAEPHQEDEVELPTLSDATVLRMAPMGVEPTIDGTISHDEEHGASVQYGAISDATGLMALRLCVFHFGYASNGVYFAARTSVPGHPQKLTANDTVSLELLLPWGTETKKFTVRVMDGKLGNKDEEIVNRDGVQSASRILDGAREYGVLCAETELFVPYSALGVTCLEEQRKIGLQMYVNFSSKDEQARWHYSKTGDEMGTFIADPSVPTVSIVNWYALEQYRSSGNYRQFYRYNNRGNARSVKLTSRSVVHRGVPRAKLDDNPEEDQEIIHESVSCLPDGGRIAAGAEADKINISWVIWSGTASILDSDISADGETIYRRRICWDLSEGRKWSLSGQPMVRTAFFPCRDNLLRIEFHPMNVALTNGTVRVVGVRENKTYFERSFVNKWNKRAEYGIVNTNLTELVPDDYEVRMTAVGADGRAYSDTSTFSITNFAWQTAEIGMDRVLIPPFTPIQVAEDAKNGDTISFLQTGYRCSGVLWDRVYAQGENLMAGKVALKMNGKDFTVTGTRIVEQADDRVVREVTATCDGVTLVATQTYDQDGFCWVRFAFDAGGGAMVRSLQVFSPLRDELAKYFNVLNDSTDVRAGPAPDRTLVQGEGEVWNSSVGNTNCFVNTTYPACIQPYIWWGGVAKGFSWITDCVRDLSLDRSVPAERIIRAGGAATLVCDLVNVPVTWTGEKVFEMGFQPSPAKPKEPLFNRHAERMYDYPCPDNADQMSTSWGTFQFSSLHNTINQYPGNDTSLRDWTYSQPVSDYAAYKVRLDAYIAKNRAALDANPSTSPADYAAGNGSAHRFMGVDLFLCYFDPLLITSFWPEWEMYKSEWYPVMWPEDNYVNEYMGQVCKSRIDKLMWDAKGAIEGGAQGLYYDCFCSKGGEGLASENVYLKPGGYYIQKQLSNVLEWRNVMKRSAVLCMEKGRTFCGRPVVEIHDTNCSVLPVVTFCLSGCSTERGSDGGDFQDRFCESYTLVNIVGASSGKCSRFIVSTNEGDVERKERELESLMGFMCAYGIFSIVDQGIIPRDWFRKAWNIPFDYGWGRTNVQHICYWDDQPKPVQHSGRDVRLTVAKKDDSALLMFGNLGDETDVSFNIQGLGFGAADLVDAETGEVLAEPTIHLRRHGYRMVRVENPVGEGEGRNYLYHGRELADYVPENNGALVLCPTDDVPFTVSFDADFSGRGISFADNQTVRVEIAEGACLKAQTLIAEGEALPGVEFVGGRLTLPGKNGSDFRCSHWGGTYTTNRVFRFDGTAVDGLGYFWGVYGSDNLIALTNGASISANSFVFTLPQNDSPTHSSVTTNNTLYVSYGSRITAGSFTFDYYGGVGVAPCNRAVVTGEGSFLGLARTSYSFMGVGETTGGNALLYEDYATGYAGNFYVGYGAGASENFARFASHASFTNEQDVFVGYAASAYSNRLEVLDGASLVQGKYNPVHVGYKGSYNEMLVSNATVVCARIGIGDYPGSDYNRVTVAGPGADVCGDVFCNQIFGFGQHNECVYDGCELGNTTSLRTYIVNAKAANACTATTNNTLRLVNGATLRSYDIVFDCGCASNLLYVGAGCSLVVGHDVKVRGLENTLVLSNASINITRSGDNLRFGSVGENDTAFAEYGNRLVLQGRPHLFNATENTGFKFYDHSVLEIDVPPEGYDASAPVFDNVGFTADWNTRLVVRNADRLRRRLREPTDFVLSTGDNFAVVNAPAGKTFGDWLAMAEGLDDGCALRMDWIDVGGVTAKRLVLHLEPVADPALFVFDRYEDASNAALEAVATCPDDAVAEVVGGDLAQYSAMFDVRVAAGDEAGTWVLAFVLNTNVAEAVRAAFGAATFDLLPADGGAPAASLKTERGLYYGMAGATDIRDATWKVPQWVVGDGGEKTVEGARPPDGSDKAFFRLRVTRKP